MRDEDKGPPFRNSPNHLEPSEVPRRDEKLQRGNLSLANADRDEILSLLLQTIRTNGTRRTLTQFYVHNLLWMRLLREADQSRAKSNLTGLELSPEQDPDLPPRLVQFGVGITLRTNTETTDPQSFEQFATHLLELKNWYVRQGGSHLALFCRRLTGASDALTGRFRHSHREMDAVWRYGIAQTACLDVSKARQTAR